MSLLKEWRKQQEKAEKRKKGGGGGGTSVIYKIKDGEAKRLVFLTELEDAERVEFFGQYPRIWDTPNPEIWGEENIFENHKDIKKKVDYFFWVYDLDDQKVKAMPLRLPPGYSALPFLVKFNEKKGKITGYAFEISRTGNGTDTTYTTMCDGEFELPNDVQVLVKKTCTHEKMIETIQSAYKTSYERAVAALKSQDSLDGGNGKVSLDSRESFD